MKDAIVYSKLTQTLREFFQHRGYMEVPTQSRLSILAACEDPKTVSTFNFAGEKWPLPQTGQMWLEYELLKNPDIPGVFCSSTSYRNEPNPVKGRHDLIFPMFEFEGRGNMGDLRRTLASIVKEFRFLTIETHSYDDWARHYSVDELTHKEEERMSLEKIQSAGIEYFPTSSHPFWNMKYNDNNKRYEKIDIVLYGMETIGSAVRETDPNKMRDRFFEISGGDYKRLLMKLFGRARVMEELDEYLALPMTPRYGAGIGITRLARAVRKLKANEDI